MDEIYCGPPPLPQEIWASWNLDPLLLGALLILTVVLRRSPPGLVGVAVLVVAFVSPLCALSSALFSARVVHHVLLVAVAAPLLAAALPRFTGGVALPFALANVILWGWHHPAAYDLALSNVAVYWLMQLSLLGSALWFWRAVLGARDAPVEQIVYIVASFALMGMLGAVLTFAPSALYAAHGAAPLDWGLTPLRDQQLGGLIMWVPAGLPYAVIAAVLTRRNWRRMVDGAPC
ncbi:cytochrome c oxidase assembly protein [Gymnodinialimonas ceratoperidinii]|uniref:Cytochrome c oxidase assembly protein n=1 Tax=Gymnodinialimonas ceratoperidinii TaxID=2856823 RepID=A0A8F6YDA8_9RHOB|nr:cytochrome c oxidase assembly protein [Gymnodinialimonas ceratoperidinii]QXT40240.1 cytochrome c oxidase assembly protein [Gymnodinialimonas ceratoperidinii]